MPIKIDFKDNLLQKKMLQPLQNSNKVNLTPRIHRNYRPSIQRNSMFKGPVRPSFIFLNFKNYLLDREYGELSQIQDIYYLRLKPPLNKTTPPNIPDFFPFVEDDHLLFRYQQIEILGQGAFGIVIKCYDHKNQETVAIKLTRYNKTLHKLTETEFDTLSALQSNEKENNHILTLKHSFHFRGFFAFVTELLSIDFYKILKIRHYNGFQIDHAKIIAQQIIEGLTYIHSKGIVHCDIKPENIMLVQKSQMKLKIVDFGCSSFLCHIQFMFVQSLYYRAPEVAIGKMYDESIDIWSFGCVLYELVVGRPLFPADSDEELLMMIYESIGQPDQSLISGGIRSEKYFNSDGSLKYNLGKNGHIYLPNKQPLEQKITRLCSNIQKIILSCIQWEPKSRPSASKIKQLICSAKLE